VVRDPEQHRRVIATVGRLAVELGLRILGAAPSCLLGPKGNREFFIHLSRPCPEQGRPEPWRRTCAEPRRSITAGLDPDLVADLAVRTCPEPSRREQP
jgi:hypothetical protein